jgi:hypothetical protein
MIRYFAKHASNDTNSCFSESLAPILVALMQFLAGLFTETINILSICSLETSKDVIMNFIALGVISEIDNYYL